MGEPESDALRAEWTQLLKEHADLVRQTEALHGSGDGKALREHNARLHAHIERLHAMLAGMEEHHRTRGPVRGLTKM